LKAKPEQMLKYYKKKICHIFITFLPSFLTVLYLFHALLAVPD